MHTFSHLPYIPRRFFLRRWADRAILGVIVRYHLKQRGEAAKRMSINVPLALAFASPAVIMLSFLWGVLFPGPNALWGVLGGILLWPLRWALLPWVWPPDDDTVRALLPAQYSLMDTFLHPEWTDDLVAWAQQDRHFDTRHLYICMERWVKDDLDLRQLSSSNAAHVFDLLGGEVGRRLMARDQADALEGATLMVPHLPGKSRRL